MINIETQGLAEAIASFNQAAQIASSPSRLMRQIGDKLENFAQERFSTETDPDGNPWTDLSPGYRAYKQHRGYSTKKNQRTGRAKEAIASRSYINQVEVGSDILYFERIQGQRPVFPTQELLPSQLEQAIEQKTEQQFRWLQG